MIETIIAAGGSVVGGIVGGLIAFWATRAQARRDRDEVRDQRSRSAAQAIGFGIVSLQEAMVTWNRAAQAHHELAVRTPADDAQRTARLAPLSEKARMAYEAMRAAVNDYASSAMIHGIAVVDGDLRNRARVHVALASLVRQVAEQGGGAGPGLVDTLSRHSAWLLHAIENYCDGKPPPAYRRLPPLDVAHAQELLDWKPAPNSTQETLSSP